MIINANCSPGLRHGKHLINLSIVFWETGRNKSGTHIINKVFIEQQKKWEILSNMILTKIMSIMLLFTDTIYSFKKK